MSKESAWSGGGSKKSSSVKKQSAPTAQQQIDAAQAATGAQLPYAGSKEAILGMMTGEQAASRLFGAQPYDIGQINKKVIEERTNMLNQVDPASTRIKQSANTQTRAARAAAQASGRNLSGEEQAQITRAAESDVGNQLYANRLQALNQYSNMGSALASNVLGSTMGFGQLSQTGTAPAAPSGGTVICTELYYQGRLSKDIYDLDAEYGMTIRSQMPHVYAGYIAWAPFVVKLMKRSEIISNIVAIFAIPWANHMAYGRSVFGRVINSVGLKICGFIGKMKERKNGRV